MKCTSRPLDESVPVNCVMLLRYTLLQLFCFGGERVAEEGRKKRERVWASGWVGGDCCGCSGGLLWWWFVWFVWLVCVVCVCG